MKPGIAATTSRHAIFLFPSALACPFAAKTNLTELPLERLLNGEIRQYGWRNLAKLPNSVHGFHLMSTDLKFSAELLKLAKRVKR